MSTLILARSRLQTPAALAALALSALALAILPFDPPPWIFGMALALFGWVGIGLGRLALGAGEQTSAATRPASATTEKIDTLLRSIAKLIQSHLSDTEAYSERLDGASARLSEQERNGPIHEILLALIADNRDMQDRLSRVRSQLEDSRIEALKLQHSLMRSEEAGMRDVVTAVGNRRFFETTFAEEIDRARKSGTEFCLALGDLDRFKHINDRFGHLVGDRVLRLFAEILIRNVRGQDRVARFGGEEFAILLPGVSLEDAIGAVERIRAVLEGKQWTLEPSGERIGKVTVSFGVGRLRPNETGVALLQRVDARLYQAKSQGRNCVVSDASPPDPDTLRRQPALHLDASDLSVS